MIHNPDRVPNPVRVYYFFPIAHRLWPLAHGPERPPAGTPKHIDILLPGSYLIAARRSFLYRTLFSYPISIFTPTWGRNGFDGDKEALAAYRAPIDSLNRWELNVIADDYELALAA